MSLFGWLLIHFMGRTARIKTVGYERVTELACSGKGFIMAVWHGRTLMPEYLCRGMGIWAITSLSRDGEIQTGIVSRFGYRIIRGSSHRGGIKAALIACKKIEEGGILSITPDGPKGPTHEVQGGTIFLSERTGCPIIPLGVGASPRKLMSAWDSYLIPLPFTKCAIVFGEPIHIADIRAKGENPGEVIRAALDKCEMEAQSMVKEGQPSRFTGIIYNTLLAVASPVLLAVYIWRILVSKKSNESWRENLGALPRFADRPEGKKLVWIHAASVGEVVASLPIQEELRRLLPDAIILMTTVTQTGNAMACKSAKSADAIAYLPLDYSMFMNRALDRMRPDVFVMVEAEIWPNLLAAAKQRGIPTILTTGVISDRSIERNWWAGWLMSWATHNIDHCWMQTRTDAERIKVMGARPESIKVVGSTKFDQEGGRLSEEAVRELRMAMGLTNGEPVFVAGSTNPGEDEPVLTAFQKMREAIGDLRLVIAPRQIERGDEIRAFAESKGFKCASRSRKETFSENCDVLVLDSYGELASVYALGEITFVGGSLIPKGGHSLVQPILQGKPVIFGPHTFKTRDIAQMAISAGVGFEVQDAEELATTGLELLSAPGRLADIESACKRLVAENQGASIRCAELIAGLVESGTRK